MNPLSLTVQAAVLGLCFWLESLAPFFMDRPLRGRAQHGTRNLTLGLLNGLIISYGMWGVVVSAAHWGELHRIGLLPRLNLPAGLNKAAGFLAFDLWMYLWHRANHTAPLLWRFHRVHHSDPALDSTSAYRFHLGEMLLSTLLRLAVIPLLGIALSDLVLYEIFLSPIIIFHHSNIALPERFDRVIRALIVTPNMHRVHHSDIPAETNSNYSSIFSFWDRLCRTFRLRNPKTIRYGLKEYRDSRWERLGALLTMPTA